MSEQAVPRKFQRSRRPFSWIGIILGLGLGIAAGLGFAWAVSPVEQVDTEPWQLDSDARTQYMIAITLSFAYDGDLGAAINRLVSLRLPGDPVQAVADAACSLATTGYANSTSGLNAMRAMMRFYQLQGRTGCADGLIPSYDNPGTVVTIDVPTPTLTLEPPASKTPTPASDRPTPTQVLIIVPTSPPQNDFELVSVNTACDVGVIQVFVVELNGSTGIPGMEIRARWDGGESRFFTGLKPERGIGYADFQMEAGIDYLIDMPGRSDPVSRPLSAVPCTTESGARALTSYTVIFRSVS
ncbi:MAG: hypothetical protein IAE80_06835 [Anaerolinea sp.]|nr:hypothetical protein [Anaerolinea sp.]